MQGEIKRSDIIYYLSPLFNALEINPSTVVSVLLDGTELTINTFALNENGEYRMISTVVPEAAIVTNTYTLTPAHKKGNSLYGRKAPTKDE